jgi:branched-chain amino acid transport system permease protein
LELVNFVGVQMLNALWLSALLFMLAVGLSVVFGLLDVLNLAHCTLYMIGAYVGVSLVGWLDSFWIALIVAPIAVTALGAALYGLLLQRLGGNHLIQALVTFGLLFIGYDLARIVWGVDMHRVAEPALFNTSLPVFGQKYPAYRLFVIGVGVLTIVGLYLALERTRLGAIVRAGVDDREMAATLGINIDRAFFAVFCIGTALAGVAGVLFAPIQAVQPGMDVEILIPALVVVVIGGPGSLKGAVLGALIIGIAQTFGQVEFPEFASFIMYAVMAVVLLIRPQGLVPVKPGH